MEKSTYYNFNLPNSANDEVADINDISDNFRAVDSLLHGTQLFFANVNATKDVELDLIDADDNIAGKIIIQRDGIIFTNVKTPTLPDYAVNKAYVDDIIGDINTVLAQLVEVTA